MDLVNRFDVATIGKPTRTPQGFLRVPAFLTRAGVFAYQRADGTTVRELRPESEVFSVRALESLGYAPVTDLHPTEMVSPTNVRRLAIGHVTAIARKDGNFVSGSITIEDDGAIKAVERGDRREISCGYQCRIDATPGMHNGEPYDVVQRDIVYNHAALGPRNWGRAGRDVALRVDTKDDDPGVDRVFRMDAGDALSETTLEAPQGDNEMTTTTKTRMEGDDERRRFDAAVDERVAIIAIVRHILAADYKYDGQTVRQIQEAVLKKLDAAIVPELVGKSDAYIGGRFEYAIKAALPAGASDRKDALKLARWDSSLVDPIWQAPLAVSKPRQDSDLADWQQPLSVTTQNATHVVAARGLPDWEQPLTTHKDRAGDIHGGGDSRDTRPHEGRRMIVGVPTKNPKPS